MVGMTKINAWGSDDPAEVAKGGTGVATTTAYAVQCGGTTATAPLQPIASVGTADQVLTSNGAGALPTFQDAGGGGSYIYISSVTASSDATIEITGLTSTYSEYYISISNFVPASTDKFLTARMSYDGGTNWRTSGYNSRSTYRVSTYTLTGYESSTTSFILTSGDGLSTSEPGAFNVSLFNPVSASYETQYISNGFYSRSSDSSAMVKGGGTYRTAEEQTAIQFLMSSGNITSGTFTLYGIKAS